MNNSIDAKICGAHAATLPPHAGRLRRKLLPVSLSLLLAGPFVFGGEAVAAAMSATSGPTGGTVVSGIGSITQNGANTVINQNSAKLALDWQTFNVGKDASVKFNQPSFTAVALNRILDQNPSQIFGHISSNGQVFLINTHGIIFGATAQMNVGGLMASTLDLTPRDFLASRYNLDAHGERAGIVNHGLIKAASGGSVSLVGGSVANDGVILANYGRINLDGADRAVLDFDGNGLINIQVTGALQQRLDSGEAAVSNQGTLKADSGTVVLQASAAKDLFTHLVNNSGVIDAGGISTQGGVVRLVAAGGNTENSGAINVSGEQGGSAQLLSDQNVRVTGSVDASGRHGGGSIRVGGGYQGGEGLQAAAVTYVGPDARLNADAVASGNGGSVVLWSNAATGFKGSISARGGTTGGNGGMAEVSSLGYLAFDGVADLRASRGAWGTLLLDPNDITISDDADANPAAPGGFDASGVFTPGDSTAASTINTATIVTQLGSSDVNIKTTDGDITVVNGFTYNGDNDRTLTLDAFGTLTFKSGATIESTGGTGGTHTLSGDLKGAGGVVFEAGSSFIANGGNLAVSGGAFTLDGALNAGGGTVTLDSTGAISQAIGGVITAGTLTGSSVGATALDGANAIGALGDFKAADFALSNAAALTVSGNVEAGDAGDPVGPPTVPSTPGNITLNSSGAINQGAGSSIVANGGDVSLSATAGGIQLGQIDAGKLTVTAAGDITQSGDALLIGGTSSFDAGAHAITLDNTGNQFTGAVSLSNSGNHDVTLDNGSNALVLGDVQVGSGALTVSGVGITQAAGSAITQEAAAGAAHFDAGAGVLQLDKANTFTGAVSLTNSGNHDVTLDNGSNALVLGDAQVGSGALTVSGVGITQAAGSAITQEAAAGAAHFDAGAGVLQLDKANTLTGAVSLDNNGANNVTLNNGAHALTLGTSTLGSGTFNLTGTGQTTLAGNLTTSGGAITLSGPVTLGAANTGIDTTDGGSVAAGAAITFSGAVDGVSTLTLNAGTAGAVTLDGAVGATTGLTGLDVTAGSFSANTLNIGTGGLAVTTQAGGIAQGGAFTVSGTSSFDAGAHAITLDNTGNHFSGAVSLSNSGANDVTLDNGSNALVLGDVQVGSGALTVSGIGITQAAGSAITQEAAAGAAQFDAGAGVLQLDKANTLTGAVSLTNSGNHDVTLDNGSNALVLGNVQVGSGALSVSGVGITQAAGSAITQAASAGAAQFDAGAGVLQLDKANTLTGAVSLDNSGANNVTLNNGAHALTLGTSTLGSGTFNLTGTGQTTLAGNLTTSGGAITLSGPVTLGAANTGIDTTDGGSVAAGAAITFSGAVDGVSTLTLNAGTAGAVTLDGAVGATTGLTGLDVTAGSFSANTLNIGTGGLAVTTQAGGIAQGGAFTISGTSSFDAGAHAITLDNTGNHFSGAVSLSNSGANDVTLDNGSNALVLGDVQVGSGALTVSGVGITQAAGSAITQEAAAGAAHFDAGAGVLQLDKANTFTGAVSLNNSGNHDVTLDNGTHALTLGTSTLGSGAFSLEGSGQTTLAGNLTTTGGAITLSGPVTLGASATGINTTGGGATAGAAITFDGALDGASGLTLDAGTAGVVTLGGAVGATTALTGLTVTAGSFSANTLRIGADGLSVTTRAGDITQGGTGAFTVAGTSNFTAMNGYGITLDNTGNDFQSAVTATGTGVSITDSNDLTIDALTNGSNGTVSLIAGGALLLPTGAIDTGTADLTLEANGGTLIAPGALTGANVTLSSQGDITLSDAVTATGTLSLTSLAGAIGQSATGSLTAAQLTGSSFGSTQLDGTNHIGSLGNFSASGFSLTNSQGLSVSGVADGGSTITLTTQTGDLTIDGTLKGTTVTLASAGAIGEGATGVIDAATLTGSSQGDAVLDGANLIDTLDSFDAANFTLVNAQGLATNGALTTTGGTGSISLKTSSGALSLGSDLTGGAISLDSADGLALANNITGSTVELISTGGSISQSAGVITAGTLSGSAADSVTLGQLNQVVALGNFDAEGFSLTNGAALAVNGVVDGGVSTALTTQTGDLTINGTLTGTAVTLTSAGAIGEGAFGAIEAATLNGSSQGNTSLGGANLVDVLGNFDAANFSLVNAQGLAANGALTTAGGAGSISLTTSSGTLSVNSDLTAAAVALSSADDLALTRDIDASGVSLAAAGDISQSTGVITAGTLTGQSTGTTTLDGANLVSTLGSFKANNFSLVNAAGLSVNGPLQITSPSGGVSLTTTSGILTVNSVLSAGAVSLNSAGSLALAHEVSGGLVTLTSGGNISQTASGKLTATTLTGHSAGSTTLNGSGNKIGTLGSFTATGFGLTNSQSLSVAGPVNGGASTSLATSAGNLVINGALSGLTTAFDVAGTVSQGAGGVITASTLRGRAGGAAALGGNNHIGTLADFSAAGFNLKNVQDLTVAGPVNGGANVGLTTTGNLVINGTLTGTTTTLDVTGAVSEASTGSIVAGTLTGDTTGAVSLTGNNRIGALGDFSAAYLDLGNALSLTVAGTVDGGTSTTLTTSSGDLTINGALKGTAMTLDSAGAIDEGSHGVITAATLTGRSTGVTALNGSNRVGSLGSFDAAGFDLTNAQALAVDGPLTIASGGRLHLTTSSGPLSVNTALGGGDVALGSAGDLTLTQAVQGATVALVSGGNIGQTASGIVTAGTLTGRSAGSTLLDRVNHVDALGSFSADGFDLATDRTLTVTGTADGGAHVNLATTHGDIVINGLVSGTRTTLTSAGAINQGSAGGIVASTLSGRSAGGTALDGNGNRVAMLEAFKAAGFSFTNGQSLTVAGPIDGGARTALATTRGGDLSIDGAVQGGVTTLVSAGAIIEGTAGSITADTLAGSAIGATTLGDAAHPLANYIGTLGGFSAPAGFSLTNARTLNLASVNGSKYTVDAGTSSTYLSVINGDLLQADQTPLYNGVGTWASTGHIGVGGAPIYVVGDSAQVIVPGGISPAYFYAVDRQGNILPLTGGSSINVPTSALTSRAQNTNKHTDSYIDPSVISANYRAFGIVPSGLLLPPDQQRCAPDSMDCDDE